MSETLYHAWGEGHSPQGGSAACDGAAPHSGPALVGGSGQSVTAPRPDSARTQIAHPEGEEIFAFPASVAQRRFWFLDQLDPGNPAYNIAVRWRLVGRLDCTLVERAFNELMRRHEMLRTTFSVVGGELAQTVSPAPSISIPVTDLSGLGDEKRNSEVERHTFEAGHERFDLTIAPLVRARLLKLHDDDHLLLVTVHHIVCDGLSMGVIARELGTIYEALFENRECVLADLPIQYADFTLWQNQWLSSGALDNEAGYWKRQLADLTPTELLTDRPRPAIQTHNGEIIAVSLPRHLLDVLREFSSSRGCTLFMTLLAAFKVLLYRYTGQTDIAVGTQVAGRNRAEVENLLGVFINSLVLRTDLSGEPRFSETLDRVRETVVQALANQELPFERLVELLQPVRDLSRNPLFGINFTSHAAYVSNQQFAGISLIDQPPKMSGALYDLNIFFVERPDEWRLSCQYNTDLYRPATISALVRNLHTLLERVAEDPEQPIHAIPLVSPEERQRLLIELNDTVTDYPSDASVQDLFEEQAARAPDAIALTMGTRFVSYGDLDRQANQLAHFLRKAGVGLESRVGLCLDRSADAVIAMLAILKAGGAYVPLDPAYPAARLQYVLDDSQAPLVVTQSWLLANLSARKCPMICLDADRDAIVRESVLHPPRTAGGNALAYVMYTSGTIGKPKGVLVPHRGVVRLVKNTTYVEIRDSDVFLQASSLSFDASTFEIWAPLLNGARLAILPQRVPSLDDLDDAIHRHGVTTLWLTAGLFHMVVDERIEMLRPLRQLLAGGDVLSPDHVRRMMRELPDCQLINGYGPTENTTFTCSYSVSGDESWGLSVPIGRPIANTQIYILDSHQSPVPLGVPGEVYIGGDGLARGYLSAAELTAAKFVANPFYTEASRRLYRSGDLARYLPDGNVEFLGRIDEQVKINGFRVELGEIESVLMRHPEVANAVVVTAKHSATQKRLDAYVVSSLDTAGVDLGGPDLAERLKKYLRQEMPGYMQPATITLLAQLPLTKNGKVDRSALPVPSMAAPHAPQFQRKPRDEIEMQLQDIWAEVLKVKAIGLRDNFFDLGGHSMLAIQLFARIKERWGANLPVSTLLQTPTVEQLGEVLREHRSSAPWSSVVPVRTGGTLPPLYIVSGVGGNVIRFHALAARLGPDYPVYALQPPGLNGIDPCLTRIEEMATHYIREIKAMQPDGPYFLAGYSFGGTVVFEMAQQLRARGDAIGLVALMDAPVWKYLKRTRKTKSLSDRVMRMKSRVRNFVAGPARLAYMTDRLTRFVAQAAFQLSAALGAPLPQWLGTISDINSFAVSRYQPRVYEGRLTLLRTGPFRRDRLEDYQLGWTHFAAGGVEVREIPGDHDNLTHEPNVEILAEQLRTCLENSQRTSPGTANRTEGGTLPPSEKPANEMRSSAWPASSRSCNGGPRRCEM